MANTKKENEKQLDKKIEDVKKKIDHDALKASIKEKNKILKENKIVKK